MIWLLPLLHFWIRIVDRYWKGSWPPFVLHLNWLNNWNCNEDLFCTKTCLVSFVKPFHSLKLLKSYISTEWISYVCALLGLLLWVKKCHGLRFVWNKGIVVMKHMLIKMKIPTVTLFWQFKACVMCEIFLKSRHTCFFKASQRRKWNFNSERFWSQVINTIFAESEKKWCHYWQPGKSKPEKAYRFRLKVGILFWTL